MAERRRCVLDWSSMQVAGLWQVGKAGPGRQQLSFERDPTALS